MGISRAGMLQRISDEAHKAAKVAAALEDMSMEAWCSKTLLEAARRVHCARMPPAGRAKAAGSRSRRPEPLDAQTATRRGTGPLRLTRA